MRSNKTRFSLGMAFGVSLGLAGSAGVVYAGPITDPAFTSGQTLTHTHMNNVRTAVNDNDARVTGMQTGVPICLTGMTRVGPTCVDNVRQANSQTWAAAVAFCRTAGKRLLTPGEWAAAQLQGVLTDAANDQLEWVDSVARNPTTPFRMFAGYMGTTATLSGEIAFFDHNMEYTASSINIYFRCAR